MSFDKPQLDDPKLLLSDLLDNDELSNLAQTSRTNNAVTYTKRQRKSYQDGIDRGVAMDGNLYLDPEEQVYYHNYSDHKYVPRAWGYNQYSGVGVQSTNKDTTEAEETGESKESMLSDRAKEILQTQKNRQIHRQEVLSKRPKFRKALAEGNTIGLFSKFPRSWRRPTLKTANGQTEHQSYLGSLSNPIAYENFSSMSRGRVNRISGGDDKEKAFENVLKGIEEVGAIRERNREPIKNIHREQNLDTQTSQLNKSGDIGMPDADEELTLGSDVKRFYGRHVPISEKTQISYGRPFNKKKKSGEKTKKQKNKGGRKKKHKKTHKKRKTYKKRKMSKKSKMNKKSKCVKRKRGKK
tara:strand:- start:1088 stop:2146 length:1059 start_codon:yes stop_codon:yes gene_type:complete